MSNSPASPSHRSSAANSSLALVLLSLALVAGCNKASASARQKPAEPRPVVTAPVTPSAAAALVPKDDIAALFRAEATHRPTDSLRVEDVLGAFTASGIEVTAERQHLAKPFGADYCAGAEARPDVVLSVCEYASAEAAREGRSASLKGLASIPNREIAQNGATTLTLRERAPSKQSHALVERLKRLFAGLKK